MPDTETLMTMKNSLVCHCEAVQQLSHYTTRLYLLPQNTNQGHPWNMHFCSVWYLHFTCHTIPDY